MPAENEDDERKLLLAVIEDEMSKILCSEYGMEGVRMRIDPQTGEILSSQAIPDHLRPRVFSAAVKQAVTRRVREHQRDFE